MWNFISSFKVTALLPAQSSAQTRIQNVLLFIDTSNNASYNQVNLLIGKPYLSIKASNAIQEHYRRYIFLALHLFIKLMIHQYMTVYCKNIYYRSQAHLIQAKISDVLVFQFDHA